MSDQSKHAMGQKPPQMKVGAWAFAVTKNMTAHRRECIRIPLLAPGTRGL